MFVTADVNTIWRRKPFEALSAYQPVLGLAPRCWSDSAPIAVSTSKAFRIAALSLPPGWASRFAKISALWLWSHAQRCAASNGRKVSGLVVTSPHYLALAKRASRSVPVFYYGSDDYSQYIGWGGESILQTEAEIVRLATHSFFVSEVLCRRAVQEYRADAARISVSANATEERFSIQAPESVVEDLMRRYPMLKRPLVGIVGAINSRIDFELIEQCLNLPEMGSLVFIGSRDKDANEPALTRLLQHPKCHFIGSQPHDSLPHWMQALDVALIPYRDAALNRACSPMRLYDHLAAGRPIVATAVNEQITQMQPILRCGANASEFISHLRVALIEPASPGLTSAMRLRASENQWNSRAAVIHDIILKHTSSGSLVGTLST